MQPVTASCEVHINTRAVVLTVTALPSPSAVVRLHLDPPTRTAELYIFENADAARPLGRWAALLPTSTDWNAGASLRRESDYASIRLSLVALGPYDSMLLQDRVREASTALPRLQQLNNRLSCRACGGAAIVAGDSFDRALRLPSSSWMELAELWGCHTETFAAAPNRELVIAPRMCYLGDAHLVVHASHVAQARVDSRRRYRCAQCAALLGSATRADGAAMLYFEALTDGRSLFSAWSVERRLARQLFELAQGSGALRFHCASQQLYMVLLNWDTEMAVAERTPPCAVLKVRYWISATVPADDEAGSFAMLEWDAVESAAVCAALAERRRYVPVSVDAVMPTQSFLWM